MKRALKTAKRWLYIVHRWLGVAGCLLFVMWFVSGLVMMYAPYPSLTNRERLSHAQPIDWSRVHLSPQAALDAAGASGFPSQFRLDMLDGEPVYRLRDLRRTTLSAEDGRRIDEVGQAQALRIARRFVAVAAPAHIQGLERDQWTVAGGYDAHRPLWKVTFDDPRGGAVYVSSATGEVVLDTTRAERFWNWVGTVPHWIYFTELRKDGALWRQVILWTSGVGIVSAVSGLWIGVLRLRVRRRYHDHKMSPYAGWMKWHHVVGLIAGLTLTTWIISGWLSVNPNDWFARSEPDFQALQRYAGEGQSQFPLDMQRLRSASPPDAREVRFVWSAGRPLLVSTQGDLRRSVLDARTLEPAGFTTEALFARAGLLMPGAPMSGRELLTREDLYWYAHHREPRLPVLRVRFGDAQATWFHIDPLTGEVLGSMNRSDRTERWAFNFLHDFDLPVLLHTRPTWDVLVWTLSLGGLVISVSSVVIGWRRLGRKGQELRRWGRRRPRAV